MMQKSFNLLIIALVIFSTGCNSQSHESKYYREADSLLNVLNEASEVMSDIDIVEMDSMYAEYKVFEEGVIENQDKIDDKYVSKFLRLDMMFDKHIGDFRYIETQISRTQIDLEKLMKEIDEKKNNEVHYQEMLNYISTTVETLSFRAEQTTEFIHNLQKLFKRIKPHIKKELSNVSN